jgi:hypothetical protein
MDLMYFCQQLIAEDPGAGVRYVLQERVGTYTVIEDDPRWSLLTDDERTRCVAVVINDRAFSQMTWSPPFAFHVVA